MASPSEQVRLGAFTILDRVGEGGAGQVWRGAHVHSGTQVAIKVIQENLAREERYLQDFRVEVRAVSALSHPHIIRVYDYGEVDGQAHADSDGLLVRGSPWLAMELATGGDLRARRGAMSWPELEAALLSVLDALAHAHARGVIHRDLKPGNVVLGGARPGPKLVDFGLATAFDPDRERVQGAPYGGTPAYMAPEQFANSWRDYGPWTDLYALGCLGWTLATGKPPFRGNWPKIVRGHLRGDLPPFRPQRPVPDGFETWLRILLEKSPGRRWACAADAAWALARLEPPPGEDPPRGEPTREGPIALEATTLVLPSSPAPRFEPGDGSGPDLRASPPPMPGAWSAPSLPQTAPRLLDAGLSLYALRDVPFVGRTEHRNTLWSHLSRARTTGRARAVVLAGVSGTGKSRMAQWLVERAHEVGAATTNRITFGRRNGARDGSAAMLRRMFRTLGLEGEELHDRTRAFLHGVGLEDPADLDAALAMVDPSRPAPSLDLRAVLLRRLLAAQTGPGEEHPRAAILWIDDIHWGRDGIALARRILRSQAVAPDPILLLLTFQEDALPSEAGEDVTLEEVLELPETELLRVDRMNEGEMGDLLSALLDLDDAVRGQLIHRAGGSPMVAIQLLGDWVRRGLLEPGRHGFRLVRAAEATPVRDFAALWEAQVDRVLGGASDQEALSLELAAVLGHAVDGPEWTAACHALGVQPAWSLVELLAEERLATEQREGASRSWSFAHGMLREAFLQRATRAGRAQELHAACARMLTGGGVQAAARVGSHLFESGQFEQAIEPLLQAMAHECSVGASHRLAVLADKADLAMDRAGEPPESLRRVRGWAVRARSAVSRNDVVEIGTWATRVREVAARNGWTEFEFDGLTDLGRAARFAGDQVQARRLLAEALELAERTDYKRGLAVAEKDRAWTDMVSGRMASAERGFERARTLFDELDDPHGSMRCVLGLARVAQTREQLLVAQQHISEVRRMAVEQGARAIEAICLQDLGEIERNRGNLEQADRWYELAASLSRTLGLHNALYPEFNRGMVLLQRGDIPTAAAVFGRSLAEATDLGDATVVLAALAGLGVCAAEVQDWHGFDRHWARFLEASATVCENDLARLARRAGDLAARHGEGERARVAYGVARRQWTLLQRDDELASIAAAVRDLDQAQ